MLKIVDKNGNELPRAIIEKDAKGLEFPDINSRMYENMVNNAIVWAKSGEAQHFAKTGELRGVGFTEADLMEAYSRGVGLPILEQIGDDNFIEPTKEKVKMYSELNISERNEDARQIAFTDKTMKNLKDNLAISENDEDCVYFQGGYASFFEYNTNSKTLNSVNAISPYELAVAVSENPFFLRGLLVQDIIDRGEEGIDGFYHTAVASPLLRRVFREEFIEIPKLYSQNKVIKNDPHGLLDEDFSVAIEPGEYIVVSDNGLFRQVRDLYNDTNPVVLNYTASVIAPLLIIDEEEENDEWGMTLSSSPIGTLSVFELNGDKVYRVYNALEQGHYDRPYIITTEKAYNTLMKTDVMRYYKGLSNEDLKFTVTKSTRLALDRSRFDDMSWDLPDKPYVGFHLKDINAYELNTVHEDGFMSKENAKEMIELNK